MRGNINSNRVSIGSSGVKIEPNYIVQRSGGRIRNVALRFLVVRVKKET